MSYGQFLEEVQYPNRKDVQAKKTRSQLKANFTEAGQIGETWRPWWKKCIQKLQIIPAQTEEKEQDQESRFLLILPSFFKLLSHLQAQKRQFSLAFRSFGHDHDEVAQEFNRACQGLSGDYPDVTLPALTTAISSSDATPLTFSIDRSDPSSPSLVSTLDSKSLTLSVQSSITTPDEGQVWSGFETTHLALQAAFKELHGSLLIKDDYPSWNKAGEDATQGKLFFVDDSSTQLTRLSNGEELVHSVFFDDNIELAEAHIVDVRNALTGESLPFGLTNGRFIVRANPLDAIMDDNYFIRRLEAAEANFLSWIEEVEQKHQQSSSNSDVLVEDLDSPRKRQRQE